jgi:hypothetical protein
LNRKGSTRNRKATAKLRSPSPLTDHADKPSPAGRGKKKANAAPDKPKSGIKVKLSIKRSSADGRATGDSGSSRASTPQPTVSASGTKVTIKPRGKNKFADGLRDLADDDEEVPGGSALAEDAAPGDEAMPDAEAADGDGLGGARRRSTGKRGRDYRNKPAGRRRVVVADDEEDEEEGTGKGAEEAPQRKRAKLSDSAADGGRADARPARNTRNTIDYSDDDDEDEEMVDVASEEDDLELDAAAAADSEDDFEQDGASSRRGAAKSKSARGAKSGGRKSTGGAGGSAAKATSASGAKKAGAAAASTAANKGMSAEARMRASIDAAKDKSLKPPGASVGTKLNPQANAFRPSGAVKSGTSTPTGAAGASAPKRPASTGKPAFGKSMSGWDQLFGGISGLSSSASTPSKATPIKPGAPSKPATPTAGVSGSGIRQDPVLEAASPADVQRLKNQATQQYLCTDECFDLLAHADIMTAFERSIGIEDRKLAARLRPCVYRAGQALLPKLQPPTQPTQSAP